MASIQTKSAVVFDLGVEYTPSTATGKTLDVSQLGHYDIKFVRFTWIDYTNTIRYKTLTASYFKKMLSSRRPGMALAEAAMGLVGSSLAEGFLPMGEYFLVPDLSSLRVCPWEPGHASVSGFIQTKTPFVSDDGTTGVETEICPRTTLKRIVDGVKQQFGAEFLVGFESEFILLKDDAVEPISRHQFSSSRALKSGSVAARVMEKIAKAVEDSGIELQMYHGEAAPGQYEVITGPLAPLEAADALIHTRDIIYNVASAHGLRATFAPRVFKEGLGNGAHAHISIHSSQPGRWPEKTSTELSTLEQTFLAGLMTHLPSLSALTLPIPASYQRVGDGVFSGGTYVCWGTENRECPVRLTNATAPTSRRFEMRFLDGTANPYVAMAGIVGAASVALRQGYELKVGDCKGPKTAAQLSDEERLELGIDKRMPRTWEVARGNLVGDVGLVNVLGPELVKQYLSVNKTVARALENEDDSFEVKIDKLIDFY